MIGSTCPLGAAGATHAPTVCRFFRELSAAWPARLILQVRRKRADHGASSCQMAGWGLAGAASPPFVRCSDIFPRPGKPRDHGHSLMRVPSERAFLPLHRRHRRPCCATRNWPHGYATILILSVLLRVASPVVAHINLRISENSILF